VLLLPTRKSSFGGEASRLRSAFRRLRRFVDNDADAPAEVADDDGGGGGGVLSSVPSLNDDELEQLDVAGEARVVVFELALLHGAGDTGEGLRN
jgi:hypothetical protein